MLLADFYKLSHRAQYPENTQTVYSTWTPRASRFPGITEVVSFGTQAFIKEYLMDYFKTNFFSRPKTEVVNEYSRIIKYTLGDNNPDTSHIEALHDLGYLPLEIKALAEGTVVPLRTPIMTIQNTQPKFFWLTNYIETLASTELWPPATSATIALAYKKLLTKYAKETGGDTGFVPFQAHDFSMRGMSSLRSGMLSGMGHLTSFVGTDTIPAIGGAEKYYNANVEKELVGTSIPATEHSVECTYGNDLNYIRNMVTKVYPAGFVSVVSDGYDYWNVIGNVLPQLKNEIMARNGKVVIRPDSGDPVKIICGDPNGATELERKGTIEALWDLFGGTTTSKGYKLLDNHIGCIYGDAITLERCEEICEKLKIKGFASTNMVYGVGSFTYQYNTRDTFGFALKSTLCVIDGDEKQIFKDPKTDNGIKKSQKGRVAVYMEEGQVKFKDQLMLNEELDGDMLNTVFYNGLLMNETTFAEIRERINGKL